MAPTTLNPTELDHRAEIYVATQCRCGKHLPEDVRAVAFEEVKKKMAGWFYVGTARKSDVGVEPVSGFLNLSSGNIAEEREQSLKKAEHYE
jgi:hypothetical protein